MLICNSICSIVAKYSNCYGEHMDIEKKKREIRRQRLRLLADKFGQSRIAAIIDVTPPYIYQLLTGRRSINENTATKYEERLSLEPGWLTKGFKNDRDKLPVFVLPENDKAYDLFLSYLQCDTRGVGAILAVAKQQAEWKEPAESEQSAEKKNPYASDRIPTKSEPDKQSQKNADPFSEDRIATAGSGAKKRTTKKKPTKKK